MFRDDQARRVYEDSTVRANIVAWYDFEPESKLLCVACSRAVVEYLQSKSLQVDSIKSINELEKIRKGSYDYAVYINGVETSDGLRLNETLVATLKDCLKDSGKLFCATNNKLAVSAFSGMADIYTGKPFDMFQNGTLYTKKQLDEMFREIKFKNIEYYYPVPDFAFATQIFSDDFLPSKGDFYDEGIRLMEGDMKVFEESNVFDQICEEGLFTELANSYLVIAEK